MPRDKTENHEKIVEAAFREFLEYGFSEASMRRIAASCGMSASGLYKHFPGKEEMFAALAEPAITGFMQLYHEIEDNYSDSIKNRKPEDDVNWSNQNETVRAMEYIYDHFDEFKLIVCKSRGTKYEDFTHAVAELEEKVTLRYLNKLRKKGIPVNEVRKNELHLLVTSSIDAVFQAVIHDFSREEAMHYAETLQKFYVPAWKALFGF
ncbi:MAG: TetR/AcrR family transcriptional regulator [Clostridia bacterium]|nr:TetR/AcrR family transcriptional regulator [Clostridia bacterium]